MAIPYPDEESPRKRLRLSISNHHTTQLPIYAQYHSQAYIAQLPAHGEFDTESYLPPQFHHQCDIPKCNLMQLYEPTQIPTPPDTPPTLCHSRFCAPSHLQHDTRTGPGPQISSSSHLESFKGVREKVLERRERTEEKERDVRASVLRDIQNAFGGKENLARFLASGSRSSIVLRWEVERLSMGV